MEEFSISKWKTFLQQQLRKRLIPITLAFELFLSVFQLLDAFHVWYFPMKHGWMYVLRFDLGFSLVPVLLPVAFVILAYLLLRRDFLGIFVSSIVTLLVHFFFGFEAAVAVFSLIQVVWALYRFIDLSEFLSWLLVLITGFKALALIHWVVYPFGLVSPFGWFAELEMALFYIAGNLAPLIVVLILMIILIDFFGSLPGFNGFFSKLQIKKHLREIISYVFNERLFSRREVVESSESDNYKNFLFLFFVVVLGVVAAVYPYSKAINPEGFNVGVDISHYIDDARIVEKDVFHAFEAWNRTRPMIFFTIYGFQRLIGTDVSNAVRFLPILLNPLMALSAFFLAWEVLGDSWAGAWTAFFTICGFQITVGMYSYFLTNMLGLCLVYSSLGFLFRSIRQDSRMCLVIASLLGGLLAFTHPWTFVQFFVAAVLTAIFIGYNIRSKGGDTRSFIAMSVYVVSIGLADLFKVLFIHGVGVVSASSMAISGVSGLLGFWDSSIYLFRHLYGGLMSSPVPIGLAIVGVLLLRLKNISDLYLWIHMAISCLVFIFSDGIIKSRLLYNIPIGLFAALGFTELLKKKFMNNFKRTFVAFVMLEFIVYLFRSLANLV